MNKGGLWLIVTIDGAQMKQKPMRAKEPAWQVVNDIRRATRRHFSAEAPPAPTAAGSDWVVVQAVRGEPVSGRNSLQSGKKGIIEIWSQKIEPERVIP